MVALVFLCAFPCYAADGTTAEKPGLTDVLKDFFSGILNGITGFFSGIAESVRSTFRSAVDSVASGIRTAYDATAAFIAKADDAIRRSVLSFVGGIKRLTNGVSTSVKDSVSSSVSTAVGSVNTTADNVKNFFVSIGEGIGSALRAALAFAKDIAEKAWDVILPIWPVFALLILLIVAGIVCLTIRSRRKFKRRLEAAMHLPDDEPKASDADTLPENERMHPACDKEQTAGETGFGGGTLPVSDRESA